MDIASVQPHEVVLEVIDKSMESSIIVIVLCFLLGVGVSLFVVHRQYNPIERLLNRFDRQSGSEVESAKECPGNADNHKNEVLIETIKDFIHANYSEKNLSLQGISGMLQMSSAYVGRIFKKHSRLSVAEYIIEVRMKEAVALLENNELPIYEIASLVGFENLHYFFKLFKQRFGKTPKEYRINKQLE